MAPGDEKHGGALAEVAHGRVAKQGDLKHETQERVDLLRGVPEEHGGQKVGGVHKDHFLEQLQRAVRPAVGGHVHLGPFFGGARGLREAGGPEGGFKQLGKVPHKVHQLAKGFGAVEGLKRVQNAIVGVTLRHHVRRRALLKPQSRHRPYQLGGQEFQLGRVVAPEITPL